MGIEITKEARAQAIASIERYCRENLEEPIGNVAAGAMLGFAALSPAYEQPTT